jgi:hypothetical protein
MSSELQLVLASPLPMPLQQLQVFAWLLGPLVMFMIGSYCIDSKNSMCVFPGTPYFYRVLRCSLTSGGDEESEEKRSRLEDLRTIRGWSMEQNPAENTSSHWWYRDLPSQPKDAFDRVATSVQMKK